MSTPSPKKFPRALAIAVGIVVILLIYDYFHPIFQPSEKVVKTPSGLQYVDLKVGTGPAPKIGQQVTVHYVGTLSNDLVFDSSLERGEPLSFTLGQKNIIKGWNEGILTMKVGGRRKLIVPPDLAYGPVGVQGTIPPNSTLTFDMELLSIK